MIPIHVQWGFCPHCLAIKNHTITVMVEYETEDKHLNAIAEHPTNLTWLINWIRKHLDYINPRFTIGQIQDAFIPVAIINGTPVCPMHLWQQTEPQRPSYRPK